MRDTKSDTSNIEQNAPFLIVHLDPNLRRMMVEICALESYTAQATSSGDEALRILRAAKGGMIVYVEPLLLEVRGNERLREYVFGRGPDDPHVFIHLASLITIEAHRGSLRADSSLAIPFTVPQVFTSIEEAQRLAQAKRA